MRMTNERMQLVRNHDIDPSIGTKAKDRVDGLKFTQELRLKHSASCGIPGTRDATRRGKDQVGNISVLDRNGEENKNHKNMVLNSR